MLEKSTSIVAPLVEDDHGEGDVGAKRMLRGTALGVPVAYLGGSKSDDPDKFTEFPEFQSEEYRRREAVETERGSEEHEFFLSHCWRNKDQELQCLKRRIISYVSGPDGNGRTYWADYLDLQAKGPVPWRKEIFEGIEKAAKVVLFVDREYLLSFNCLQELAYALEVSKPIVVVVMVRRSFVLRARDDERHKRRTRYERSDHF